MRLTEGTPRPSDPTLDLCKGHHTELLRAFTSKGAKTHGQRGRPRIPLAKKLARLDAKRAADRERKREEYVPHKRKNERVHIHGQAKQVRTAHQPLTKSGRYANGQAPWQQRMDFILGMLPSVGTKPTVELQRQAARDKAWEALQMGDANYGMTLQRLKAAGLIVQKGTRRYASYGRANGAA